VSFSLPTGAANRNLSCKGRGLSYRIPYGAFAMLPKRSNIGLTRMLEMLLRDDLKLNFEVRRAAD